MSSPSRRHERRRHRRHHRRHHSSGRKQNRNDISSPTSTSNTNTDKTVTSDCPSPPSYSVVEGADGRLVNPTLNVTWPERPTAGRHSMMEYLKRRSQRSSRQGDGQDDGDNIVTDKEDSEKKSTSRSSRKKEPDECCEIDEFTERSQRIDFVESQARKRKAFRREEKRREKERRKAIKADWLSLEELARQAAAHNYHIAAGTSCSHHARNGASSVPNMAPLSDLSSLSSTALGSKSDRGTSLLVPPTLSNHFIGVMPASKVERFLRPTQFVLYYQRAQIQFLDDIPLSLPLRMAYMTNRGKVHHFAFDVEMRMNQRRVWQVIIDDNGTNSKKQPCFLSLSSLISFYEAFVSLKSNGEVEVFSIPESAE